MGNLGGRQAIGAGLAAWAALAGLPSAGANAAPPPGATARCNDGTYSSSLRHSGTCSDHAGVRTWLDGSVGARLKAAPVGVGSTVLLRPRMRASGCRLGPKPDRRCSPGAFYRGLTKDVICSARFRTSAVRDVPGTERHAVEVEYGLSPRLYGSTLEVDHIVSLELGGSNDIANLFPERANADPGYHVKDRLENRLHALVCAGDMSLTAARNGIAGDWEQLYRKVFGKAPGV